MPNAFNTDEPRRFLVELAKLPRGGQNAQVRTHCRGNGIFAVRGRLPEFNPSIGLSRLPDRAAIAKLLPPEVHLDTVSEHGFGVAKKVNIEDELIRVKARVGNDGVLHDERGKPIAFFSLTGCWGNPPVNHQQIIDEQNRRLEELLRTHTVITLTCNPRGIPIP